MLPMMKKPTVSKCPSFVLSKKGKLSTEVLVYDIAKIPRELKVWDYPKAGDKREKVDERIYRQTLGFN
jgi:hypothetical protein